ncbi:MAG: phospholipase D family protein, partial [Chloroflexota bacterium]|nr:phospholipase D family protein [Chloroflexota bacterium]
MKVSLGLGRIFGLQSLLSNGRVLVISKGGWHHSHEIIAGIDHRGTSYEGLQSLLDSVSPTGRVVVFHNPLLRTFHPKVYLFKSSVAADMVVGSGNLTGGGLFANYEACIRLRLDLAKPKDAAILNCVEQVLDRWRDQSAGTACLLDDHLLTKLAAWGLTPSELLVTSSLQDEQDNDGGPGPERDDFPFAARAEPGVPRLATQRQRLAASGPIDQSVAAQEPSIGFVMTLQQTDVGVGQATAGASRRSPEIFIPLVARNADPGFWNWSDGFVEDPRTPGKLDRRGVRMRLAS